MTETNEPLLIGYYGEGGIGSHPAILTPSELSRCGFIQGVPRYLIASEEAVGKIWKHQSDEFKIFIVTSQSLSIPGALACAFNNSYEWNIRGISESLGQTIIDMIGRGQKSPMFIPTINSIDNDIQDLNEIEEMLELPQSDNTDTTLITIIPNPTPNMVYWSDEPEVSHTYWIPPYTPMALNELV